MKDMTPGVRLYGEGFVVRAEQNECGRGFAASVLFHPEPEESMLSNRNSGARRPVN
jgi:hypothetical protein